MRRLSSALLRGPSDASYRWLTIAWAAAVAARLTLGNTTGPGWMLPSLALVVGAIGLIVQGGRVWWLLSALALYGPLLFLRDWMTQSLLMALIATVGAITAHGGEVTQRPIRPPQVVRAAGWLTIATYWLAAFHKTNADFFEPTLSCATNTWTQLSSFLPTLGLPEVAPLAAALPFVAVAWEVALALLLWRRPRVGVPLGIAFHIPLTLVLAPAFAFVMFVGYTARADARLRADWTAVARRVGWRWALIAPAALALLWLPRGAWPGVVLGTKWVLMVSALIVTARCALGGSDTGVDTSAGGAPGARAAVAVVAVALYGLNGLTPYTGLQVQHAGAMLSNLRIDEGCWNHLIVPESVRFHDGYVRIESASYREEALTSQLWSHTALLQMRRNWCRGERAIELTGTIGARPFHLGDLCDWSVELPGATPFPDYLRFQKNLERTCQQQCLH